MPPTQSDSLRRALEAVEDAARRLDAAVTAEREAQLLYRATPDGLSESLRSIEVAQRSGAGSSTIDAMLRDHVRAEQVAADEYRTRAARWGHGQWDGFLYACPTGDDEVFSQWAIDNHITATYRVHPDGEDMVKVTVIRGLPGGKRRRTWVLVNPGFVVKGSGLTLLQVFTLARGDARQQAKLDRLLGG